MRKKNHPSTYSTWWKQENRWRSEVANPELNDFSDRKVACEDQGNARINRRIGEKGFEIHFAPFKSVFPIPAAPGWGGGKRKRGQVA